MCNVLFIEIMAAPSERHEKTKEEINVSEKPCKKPDSRKRNMLEFEDIPRNYF